MRHSTRIYPPEHRHQLLRLVVHHQLQLQECGGHHACVAACRERETHRETEREQPGGLTREVQKALRTGCRAGPAAAGRFAGAGAHVALHGASGSHRRVSGPPGASPPPQAPPRVGPLRKDTACLTRGLGLCPILCTAVGGRRGCGGVTCSHPPAGASTSGLQWAGALSACTAAPLTHPAVMLERCQPKDRERMDSPTLQTLQEPILRPSWVCFRDGFPNPRAAFT